MLLTGCQVSPNDNQVKHSAFADLQLPAKRIVAFQQLIIKFKSHTVTCDADGISRFSHSIKVPIEYVRMMSDESSVLRQFMDKEGEFSKGQILLGQHPDVEWMESNAIRKML